jgi:hypothetical protein
MKISRFAFNFAKANEILQKDIRLENPAHLRIPTEYIRQNSGKLKWGRIS